MADIKGVNWGRPMNGITKFLPSAADKISLAVFQLALLKVAGG